VPEERGEFDQLAGVLLRYPKAKVWAETAIRAMPARRASSEISDWIERTERAAPVSDKNTGSCVPVSSRSSRYVWSARRAVAFNGTYLSLLPLPQTRTLPCRSRISRSSMRSVAASLTRRPACNKSCTTA